MLQYQIWPAIVSDLILQWLVDLSGLLLLSPLLFSVVPAAMLPLSPKLTLAFEGIWQYVKCLIQLLGFRKSAQVLTCLSCTPPCIGLKIFMTYSTSTTEHISSLIRKRVSVCTGQAWLVSVCAHSTIQDPISLPTRCQQHETRDYHDRSLNFEMAILTCHLTFSSSSSKAGSQLVIFWS